MSTNTPSPERDETGKFTTDVDEEIFEAMPEVEPMRASDVAEIVGVSKSTANHHLNNLADEGRIEKKKFHEKRVVFFRTPSSN